MRIGITLRSGEHRREKFVHVFRALVIIAVVMLSAAPSSPAKAIGTNRYVALWGNDTNIGCTPISSPCLHLGHAISESSAGDTIYIDAGTFQENVYIPIDLNVIGQGVDPTILDGGGISQVIGVAFGTTVNISKLTVRNGSNGAGGGGISNAGNLALDEVKVTENSGYGGGGILTEGPLTMTNSIVSWNTADPNGGAAVFFSSADTSSLTNVTMNNNSSGSDAGVHIQAGATVNLTNVTITGNNAGGTSALVVTVGSTANAVNSTIAGNTAGGLWTAIAGYGTLSFKNTIVAGNSPANCFIAGGSSWTSLGNNLDSGNTCGFASAGDLINTDPQLGMLGNYDDLGGWITTRPLLTGSPAIDAGTNTGCPATDARGFPRPVDGNGDNTATCDIGATEMKEETTSTSITGAAPDPSKNGQLVNVGVTVTGSLTTPTGNVSISGDASCASGYIVLSSGSGNCDALFLKPGARGILVRYLGDSVHDASQQALLHIVIANTVDYDGEGGSDMGYFRASGPGLWAILKSGDSFSYGTPQYFSWGASTDVPLSGDFDGDLLWDPAVRTPPASGQSAAYRILLSSTGYDFGSTLTIPAGWPGLGDTPVVGDFNGDGKAEPAIWRGNTGVWIIPLSPSYGSYMFTSWGATGDTPIAADIDGDGQSDIGYWHPATGVWGFFKSSTGYSYGSAQFFSWGTTGDTPVMRDYDADALADPAVVIPPASGMSAAYRILLSSTGYNPASSLTVPAGWPGLGDTPVPADYDGDGKADPGIWRGSTGIWIVPTSSSSYASYLFRSWGTTGDQALK